MATKKIHTVTQSESSPADELAKHIAVILNHPATPVDIYNALSDAVSGLDAPPGFSSSEEYIRMCLRNHFIGGAR